MFSPVEKAFGRYLADFHASVIATSPTLEEFRHRDVKTSILWAPGRLVDKAEEMLLAWQRSDARPHLEHHSSPLPVILVAIDKNHTPTGRDYTRQIADPLPVMFPHDEKQRMFRVRTIAADLRAQLCIFAHDEPSARSLAAQFLLFLDATPNRRFTAKYTFAGQASYWPVQIDSPETPAMLIAHEAKNLTILAVDVTLRATVPLFDAPDIGQVHDGKGTPATSDPAGWAVVTDVHGTGHAQAIPIKAWKVGDGK